MIVYQYVASEQPADNWTVRCAWNHYANSDGDGFGDFLFKQYGLGTKLMYPGNDHNDGDIAVNPNATETCNGVGNNCSGDELDATDVLTKVCGFR